MKLSQLNHLPTHELKAELFRCCGCSNWANRMLALFPAEDMIDLFEDADDIWFNCSAEDWKEAFTHHPKIGDKQSLKEKFASTATWAGNEQSGVDAASDDILDALAEGNKLYLEKFGFIFIVFATGKTAKQMLDLLNERLPNSPEEEIKIAAAEQSKITQLRLQKLLGD